MLLGIKIAVVIGTVLGVFIDDGNDEFLQGGMEEMVTELIDVGDAFECLHGDSPFMGTKKPADPGGRAGADKDEKIFYYLGFSAEGDGRGCSLLHARCVAQAVWIGTELSATIGKPITLHGLIAALLLQFCCSRCASSA